jgi:hypothetical protein
MNVDWALILPETIRSELLQEFLHFSNISFTSNTYHVFLLFLWNFVVVVVWLYKIDKVSRMFLCSIGSCQNKIDHKLYQIPVHPKDNVSLTEMPCRPIHMSKCVYFRKSWRVFLQRSRCFCLARGSFAFCVCVSCFVWRTNGERGGGGTWEGGWLSDCIIKEIVDVKKLTV